MADEPNDITLQVLKDIREELRGMRTEMREGLQQVSKDIQTLVSRTGQTDERVEAHETRLRRIEQHLHLEAP